MKKAVSLMMAAAMTMGLASAAGSLLSIIICVIAYAALMRREKKSLQGG